MVTTKARCPFAGNEKGKHKGKKGTKGKRGKKGGKERAARCRQAEQLRASAGIASNLAIPAKIADSLAAPS